MTINTCPICNEPTHATEGDDEGRCATCSAAFFARARFAEYAARLHVADVLSMGYLTAEQIATDAAPLETWDSASIGEAVGLPDDASDEQIAAARVLLANSIRLAARQATA
jgi:hypothetical protein